MPAPDQLPAMSGLPGLERKKQVHMFLSFCCCVFHTCLGARRASAVAAVGRDPTALWLGRWGCGPAQGGCLGRRKTALDQHPVASQGPSTTAGCGDGTGEAPLLCLQLASSRMKVRETYSAARGWLPFSSASGQSTERLRGVVGGATLPFSRGKRTDLQHLLSCFLVC